MKNALRRFLKDESGATMVEYAILVMVISLALIVLLGSLADLLVNAFEAVVLAFGSS